jgi:hypothetical protein
VIDKALLEFFYREVAGIIRLDRKHVDRVRVIAQIVRAFPDTTFTIVAARKADVIAFARRLKKLVPECRWTTPDSPNAEGARVAVSTARGMGDWNLDHNHRDVILFLNALEALGDRPKFMVNVASEAQLFGLLDLDQHVSPFDQTELCALFGVASFTMYRHASRQRTVHSFQSPICGGPRLPARLDTLRLKRKGLWQHPVRNRRVARLAQALRKGPRTKWSAFVPEEALGLLPARASKVCILVENLEHALALGEQLPGWPLLVGANMTTWGLTKAQQAHLKRRLWVRRDQPPRTIATVAALPTFLAGEYDVVIRADGLPGVPETLVSSLISREKKDQPLVLIDFNDHHHPTLRRCSQKRAKCYTEHGWDIGWNPQHAAALPFLPKGRSKGR